MILTRTPFRISLGGGSTDLPAYYEQFGGFIFAVAIDLYMHLTIIRPPIDDLIRLKYRQSEEVDDLRKLNHHLARAALLHTGITKMIEISSLADAPDGTGLGTSGSYLVGLLLALYALKGQDKTKQELAEEAFALASGQLGLPDGKQDFYTATFGDFTVLEIDKNGEVKIARPSITEETKNEFESRTLLFYTGVRRPSSDLLRDQQDKVRAGHDKSIELKHITKEIGRKILAAFESGNLDEFGRLMDEHWRAKKEMAAGMSNELFDSIYRQAKQAGALGGKIIGAGGGGFFLIFCEEGGQDRVKELFSRSGMRPVNFRVEKEGSKILSDNNHLYNPRYISSYMNL